ELVLDLGIRWSSTYLMLQRLHQLLFLARPSQKEVRKHALLPVDWVLLEHVTEALKVPHQVQQVMSSESTPSLSMVVPAMEAMVEGWRKLELELPHLQPMIMPGRAKIEQYLSGMRNSKAYVIAMCKCYPSPLPSTP
ncbi:hypothetical protein BOTBODRAFT_122732, partial [Botryobasidium botryosum FD-172 SS1]